MPPGLRKYWKAFLSGCVLALLFLAYFVFRYRRHLSSAFGWISEETGGRKMAIATIALALCGLIYALFCLIFPIIVCLRLGDLRRRLIDIEQTIRPSTRAPGGAGDETVKSEAAGKTGGRLT